jgi:hypothetical protein
VGRAEGPVSKSPSSLFSVRGLPTNFLKKSRVGLKKEQLFALRLSEACNFFLLFFIKTTTLYPGGIQSPRWQAETIPLAACKFVLQT